MFWCCVILISVGFVVWCLVFLSDVWSWLLICLFDMCMSIVAWLVVCLVGFCCSCLFCWVCVRLVGLFV